MCLPLLRAVALGQIRNESPDCIQNTGDDFRVCMCDLLESKILSTERGNCNKNTGLGAWIVTVAAAAAMAAAAEGGATV